MRRMVEMKHNVRKELFLTLETRVIVDSCLIYSSTNMILQKRGSTFWNVPRRRVVVLPAAVIASLVWPKDGNLVLTTL